MKHEYVCRVCGQAPNAGECPGSGDVGLFDLPPVARNTDPSTSHAAVPDRAKRGSDMMRLLDTYKAFGRTDEEAAVASGMGTDGGHYTKRCSDLRNGGYIQATGDSRRGSSGKQQRVCVITPKGHEALRKGAF